MLRTLVACFVSIAVVAIPIVGMANIGGAPSGHTGSPLYESGDTCNKCHMGPRNAGPGGIQIQTPTTTYVPGSLIPIDVALKGVIQNPDSNGYQIMAAENGRSFAAPGWTLVDSQASRQIAGHVMQAGLGIDRTMWKHYFRTPTSTAGVTMWAAGNDANGNGTPMGDLTYTTAIALVAGRVPLSLDGATLPSPGKRITWNLDVPSDARKPYVMAVSLSNAGIRAGNNRTIPLFIDDLFAGSVNGAFPFFVNYRGVLDQSGRAAATFAVPNFKFLSGITLHHAFVVIDAAQPNGIGTISNGYPLVIL